MDIEENNRPLWIATNLLLWTIWGTKNTWNWYGFTYKVNSLFTITYYYCNFINTEGSLKNSKSVKVQTLLQFLDRAALEKRFTAAGSAKIVNNTVQTICSIKNIRPDVHQPYVSKSLKRLVVVLLLIVTWVKFQYFINRFIKLFGECVNIIWGLNQLLHNLEDLRTTGYDSSNQEHEEILLELWELLMPGRKLESRINNSWKEIGFQGEDPKTDFRGMGILGLHNLQ